MKTRKNLHSLTGVWLLTYNQIRKMLQCLHVQKPSTSLADLFILFVYSFNKKIFGAILCQSIPTACRLLSILRSMD